MPSSWTIGPLAVISLLPVVAVIGLPSIAHAVPQFAVEAASSCIRCHGDPGEWPNPELKERKCSLSCGACHVNPTGGGMKHEGGLYYGKDQLAALGDRPTNDFTKPTEAPPPGHPDRFAGMNTFPLVQVSADFRAMAYYTEEGDSTSIFPMQTEVSVAVAPYNPKELNKGRVTLLAAVAAEGSRRLTYGNIVSDDQFDDWTDRIYLKEAWALYHDLPYQAYVKAGKFLPPFGLRLDDHTAFIRQEQSFDHERQVTGVEIGLNPNYFYGHLAAFANTPSGKAPIVHDSGGGVALMAGTRHLLWQAGGQMMYEARDDSDDLWIGANWGLNLFEVDYGMKGLQLGPFTYLGEIDLRRRKYALAGVDDTNGLAAFHEVNWHPRRWVRFLGRYDWMDPDLDVKDDHRHRYTVGGVVYPLPFLEVIAQWRWNVEPEAIRADDNDGLLQVHVWH